MKDERREIVAFAPKKTENQIRSKPAHDYRSEARNEMEEEACFLSDCLSLLKENQGSVERQQQTISLSLFRETHNEEREIDKENLKKNKNKQNFLLLVASLEADDLT